MTFFFVVTPGLEKLAIRELKTTWKQLLVLYPTFCKTKIDQITELKGGFEAEFEQKEGWLLNHYLKIPTRILQRIESFPAKDFPKLFKKLQTIKWQNYLRQGPIDIVVSSFQSRLKIKERIAETVQKAVAAANDHQPLRKKFLETPQTIFVRIEKDVVTVSLDTSGEALYKRGLKTHTVEAPIRETIASAAIQWMLMALKPLPQDTIFTDPVCGSGTLLFEIAALPFPIKKRLFAYRNFPCAGKFAEPQWKELELHPTTWTYEGYDFSEKSLNSAKKNSKHFPGRFQFEQRDLMETVRADGIRVVMMNPPYGERLIGHESEALLKQAVENYDPIAILLIVPSKLKKPQLSSDYRWHTTELRTISGGIDIVIRLATRK
jgi:putative N6-adenine-specific DNA methylase